MPSLLYQWHENLPLCYTVNSWLQVQPLRQTYIAIQMSLALLHMSLILQEVLSVLTHIPARLFHIHFSSRQCEVFYTHLPI